jgi:hypothetical protein
VCVRRVRRSGRKERNEGLLLCLRLIADSSLLSVRTRLFGQQREEELVHQLLVVREVVLEHLVPLLQVNNHPNLFACAEGTESDERACLRACVGARQRRRRTPDCAAAAARARATSHAGGLRGAPARMLTHAQARWRIRMTIARAQPHL